MADNVLDSVVFDLGIDRAKQQAAYAQVDAETDALASRIKSKTSSAFFADTQAGAAKLLQARNAVSQWGNDVENAMKRGHGATSTAAREFRALFDELSSGRVRQSPGTLAIIATRVFGISGATLAWGVALAAIPVLFVAAAASADASLSKIQRQLKATGDATGATVAQITAMAQHLNGVSGLNTGSAQRTLGILAGNGAVGAQMLPGAAQAAAGLAAGTGTKLDKATEELAKALSDPAKGAKELNDQIKLLSAAQTREVDDLVASGQAEAAQKIIVDALNDRFKNASDSASFLSRMLTQAGNAAGNFWSNLGKAMGAGLSPQEQLARQQAIAASAQRTLATGPSVVAQQQLAAANTEIARIRGEMATDTRAAASGARRKAQDDAVNAALEYRSKLDVAGKKLEEEANARTALTAGLKQAQQQLADLQARHASPGEIAAAQRNLRDIQVMTANAANPNYRWGSGIPKGPKNPGIGSSEAVDAAVKDQLQAELALTRSIQDRYRLQNDIAKIENKAKDDALQRQLTEARITGDARTRALNAEAAAEQAKRDKAQRDFQEALQDEQLTYDRQMSGYKVAGLQAQASINQTGTKRASLELQIMQAEQEIARRELEIALSRNPNLTQQQKDAQRFGLAFTQSAQQAALGQNSQFQATAQTRALQDQNRELGLQVQLKYADAELRSKEMADLQAEIQLKQEGWKIDDDGYQNALKERQALLEKQAQLNDALQGQSKNAQMLDTLRSGLDSVLLAGTRGFTNMRQAAANFLIQLGNMAIELYILRPLLNMLFGMGGTPGGLLGSLLFGGGKAAGGWIDPSKFYLVGEHGPELLGPGVSGHVSPLKAPSAQAMSVPQTVNHNVAMTFAVEVAGQGDKELLSNMKMMAETTVKQGLQQYGRIQARTGRGALIQQNRRALV